MRISDWSSDVCSSDLEDDQCDDQQCDAFEPADHAFLPPLCSPADRSPAPHHCRSGFSRSYKEPGVTTFTNCQAAVHSAVTPSAVNPGSEASMSRRSSCSTSQSRPYNRSTSAASTGNGGPAFSSGGYSSVTSRPRHPTGSRACNSPT